MDLKKARQLMEKIKIEVLILNSPLHIFYATGGYRNFDSNVKAENELYLLIPRDESNSSYLIAPHCDRCLFIDTPIWVEEKRWYGDFYIKGSEDFQENMVSSPIEGLEQALNELGLINSRIGIEENLLPLSHYEKIKTKLPESEIVYASDLLRELKMIKTDEEVRRIRISAQIVEKTIEVAIENAEVGMTEIELEKIMRQTMIREGGKARYIQIGTGGRGAGIVYPSSHELKKGDVVRIDASAEYMGYISDICRIFTIGEASEQAKRYFNITSKAEQAAISIIKPGTKASDVFNVAMQVLLKAGYSDYRRRHVGHGIGLESEADPILGPKNETKLEAGMVLCVETPYYIWGLGGFAPEDELLVTKDGHELLTTPQKEIIEI